MLSRLIIVTAYIYLILIMQGCSALIAISQESEPHYLDHPEIEIMENQQELESILGRSFFSIQQGDGSRIEVYDHSYYFQEETGAGYKKARETSRLWLQSFGIGELFSIPYLLWQKSDRSYRGGVERITVLYSPQGKILNVLRGARLIPVTALQTQEAAEIDFSSLRIATIIPIDATLTGMVVEEKSIWITGPYRVHRFERSKSKVIADIPIVEKIGAITIGEGTLWVTHVKSTEEKGSVSRIDPIANKVISEIQVGRNPTGIAFADNAVWVANSGDGTVSCINPKTNEVVSTIPVGKKPAHIAVGEGAVWVANSGNGTISRINPLTNSVVVNIPIGKNPASIKAGEGFIWIMSEGDASIFRIDPRTNKVSDKTISVNKKLVSMDVGGGALWLVNYEDGILLRFDPKTLLVNRKPIFIAPSKIMGNMFMADGITYIVSDYKASPSPSNLLQIITPRDEKSKDLPLGKP